ncbi:hypothetical protein BTN50_1240 [Candidatus Enterovibrio altilux]|uniref:Uncharacterized protein n=1 Tax=Candidatus Enterovibrio altilux TaxID=1927128 RepID=A0A291B9M4_9GAMM|nr:hypothetical protein BTN50_1240 [Candidatus Enterovibrio luxaltus]
MVWLIEREAELINIAYASVHAEFECFSNLGKDPFNPFLSLSLICQYKVLDVLII